MKEFTLAEVSRPSWTDLRIRGSRPKGLEGMMFLDLLFTGLLFLPLGTACRHNPQEAESRNHSTDFPMGQLYRSVFSKDIFSFQMTLVVSSWPNKQANNSKNLPHQHTSRMTWETPYVDQTSFILRGSLLSVLLECWVKDMHCHVWLICIVFSC